MRRTGIGIWEQGWYAGHQLPGYSVLFPPAGALLSPQFVAAACAVVAAWCFERLARGWWPAPSATAAAAWFAVGVLSTLVGGAFAAGLAPALGALLAASRGRPALAARAGRRDHPDESGRRRVPRPRGHRVVARLALRAAIAPTAGALVPGLMIALAFPQGGSQPFAFSSFFWSLAVAVAVRHPAAARERVLRIGGAALRRRADRGDRHRHPARREPRPARRGLRRPAGDRSAVGTAPASSAAALRPAPLLAVARAGPLRDPRQRRAVEQARLPPAAARRARAAHRRGGAVPDRDPVHGRPLGDALRRAAPATRARLGASAGRQAQRPLL